MKTLINKNKLLFKYILIIMILSILFTTLEYIGLSYKFLTTLLLIMNLCLTYLYSYKYAIRSTSKGYKSGIKSGITLISTLVVLNIITLNKINYKTIIYYLIIMLVSIASSIISKNKQKNYSSSNLE